MRNHLAAALVATALVFPPLHAGASTPGDTAADQGKPEAAAAQAAEERAGVTSAETTTTKPSEQTVVETVSSAESGSTDGSTQANATKPTASEDNASATKPSQL